MFSSTKVNFAMTAMCLPVVSLALGLSISQPLAAQTTDTQRSCVSVASDPDGDGFGWEWDNQLTRYRSCTVTDQSATAPQAVDAAGNFNNEFQVRAYWNANRDFAGRTIVCESMDNFRSAFEFKHDALPQIPPYIAFADFSGGWLTTYHTFLWGWPAKVWTVVNGSYSGPMPINSWVQIIDFNGQPNNAIRVNAGGMHYECFDPTGRAFVPTGSVDEILPEPQQAQLPTTLVNGADNSVLAPNTEVIIDKRTGNEVFLQSAIWDLHKDLTGRVISCSTHVWSDSAGQYLHRGASQIRYISFYPIYQPSSQVNGLVTETTAANDYITNSDFIIESGELKLSQWFQGTSFHEFFAPKYVEFIESQEFVMDTGETIQNPASIGVWEDSDTYYHCRDTGKIVGVGLVDATAARDLRPSGKDSAAEISTDDESTTTTQDNVDTNTDSSSDNESNDNATPDDLDSNLLADTSSSGGGAFGVGVLILLLLSVRAKTKR